MMHCIIECFDLFRIAAEKIYELHYHKWLCLINPDNIYPRLALLLHAMQCQVFYVKLYIQNGSQFELLTVREFSTE